jgi:hypothetical protein
MKAFEQSITGTDALGAETAAHFRARLALYRALVAPIKRLYSEALEIKRHEHRIFTSNGVMSFESR